MEIYSLDIGGSSIKRGLVRVSSKGAEITSHLPAIRLTTRSVAEVKEQVIASVADHARKGWRKVIVAISTSGAVDRSGLVINSGHFDDYSNVNWSDVLKLALRKEVKSVTTVNDGKASTWAEYQRVGRGNEVFTNFVVGTGVGGGIVCFDRLLFGDDETAGALGHMKVGGDATVECSCGRFGCVETLASGPAIARAYHDLRQHERASTEQFSFEDVFQAAKSGDGLAIQAFSIAGSWLGAAISNVINVLNPRHITVGGGVLEASTEIGTAGGPYLRAAITRANELAFDDIAAATIIEPATTGNDGGLLGAALLASRSKDA